MAEAKATLKAAAKAAQEEAKWKAKERKKATHTHRSSFAEENPTVCHSEPIRCHPDPAMREKDLCHFANGLSMTDPKVVSEATR